MTYKILCCDGGGIRGLITALLIQNLEEVFEGFIDKADGFAGTSTGGLIALGLAAEQPIDEIVSIYKTKGSEIFTPNGWFQEEALQATPAIHAAPTDAAAVAASGVKGCKYKSDGLETLAGQLLGTRELRDAAKMVAVTSAQLWDEATKSWLPRTLSNIPDAQFQEVSMVHAALATSAAPTYFPPHEIPEHLSYFVDGGLFANNPTLSAVSEALKEKVDGHPARTLGDIRVLSLGTGKDPQSIPSSVFDAYKPLKWGASYWLWPWAWGPDVPPTALLSLMFEATSANTTAAAEQLLGGDFCRANVPLKAPYPLDDIKNIAELEEATLHYMTGDDWRDVREWVEKNWM